MSLSYYSLIRRTHDGCLVGWVPDLPGVQACGQLEDEIVRELSRLARELIARIASRGLSLPRPSLTDSLPLGDRQGRYRRLLLVIA